MINYHAHIYFLPYNYDLAERLFSEVSRDICRPWKIYDRPVGPHPRPMFELHFTTETRGEVVEWLKSSIGDLSALVHEDTGDDLRDHTEGHLWIGEELPIDFSFFQLIQQDPSLVIHQN